MRALGSEALPVTSPDYAIARKRGARPSDTKSTSRPARIFIMGEAGTFDLRGGLLHTVKMPGCQAPLWSLFKTHALRDDNRALVQRGPPIPSDVWALENILDSRSPTPPTPTLSEFSDPPSTPPTLESTRAVEDEDYFADPKTKIFNYLSVSASTCAMPSASCTTLSHAISCV